MQIPVPGLAGAVRTLLPGWKLPTSTPMTMAASTQTARKRSRKDIAVSTAAFMVQLEGQLFDGMKCGLPCAGSCWET